MGIQLKKTVASMLEMPKEVVLNLPGITILGNEELTLENYKSIVEYSEERVRINTGVGTVSLSGRNLVLKQITTEFVVVTGFFLKVEFLI